ncbi:unnamed protein product, partial [Ectocarpus sp. 13 AM-2016]
GRAGDRQTGRRGLPAGAGAAASAAVSSEEGPAAGPPPAELGRSAVPAAPVPEGCPGGLPEDDGALAGVVEGYRGTCVLDGRWQRQRWRQRQHGEGRCADGVGGGGSATVSVLACPGGDAGDARRQSPGVGHPRSGVRVERVRRVRAGVRGRARGVQGRFCRGGGLTISLRSGGFPQGRNLLVALPNVEANPFPQGPRGRAAQGFPQPGRRSGGGGGAAEGQAAPHRRRELPRVLLGCLRSQLPVATGR